MKFSIPLALGVCAAALSAPTLAQQVEANATTSASATNSTTKSHATIQEGEWRCSNKVGSVHRWYYQTWNSGPHWCVDIDASDKWGMLSAYRRGGQENVHWKYTNDVNDPACLTNWKYHAEDGTTWIATVERTTMIESSRRWCALPVYRQGGVKDRQWSYCECYYWEW